MRGMFVDQSLSWVTEQQFRNNKKTDVLLAVESLL